MENLIEFSVDVCQIDFDIGLVLLFVHLLGVRKNEKVTPHVVHGDTIADVGVGFFLQNLG